MSYDNCFDGEEPMSAYTEERRKTAETILEYWHTMEFLSQDRIPQLTPEERRKNQDALQKKGKQKALRLLIRPGKGEDLRNAALREAERHGMKRIGNLTIYAGRIRRELCIRHLALLLSEKDSRVEDAEDEIAWFAFQLDGQGTYIDHTYSLSPVLWAVGNVGTAADTTLGRTLNERAYRETVADVENGLRKLKEDRKKAGEPEQMRMQDLLRLYEEVEEEYVRPVSGGTEQAFSCIVLFQAFVDGEAQEKYADDNYLGLGMDFYSADLKMVLNALRTDDFGKNILMRDAITDYITGPWAEAEGSTVSRTRFNVGDGDKAEGKQAEERKKEMRGFLSDVLDVRNAPLGKWPSRFMPALMQQIAVNLACGNGEETTIFSVNGPPGTGKTTLLKEIVVDHVVERAALLAQYEKADDAFEACSFRHGESINNGYCRFYSKYYRLKDDRINDYSILVTSNNNAAVQNITKELPVQGGITGALEETDADSAEMRRQLQEVRDLFTVEKSESMEELYRKSERHGRYPDIYFSAYAKELLDGEEAWGLISAALGKKSNIHRFYRSVLQPLDTDFYRKEIIKERPYEAARQSFLTQKKKVEQLQKELEALCTAEREMRETCASLRDRAQKLEEKAKQDRKLVEDCAGKLEEQRKICSILNERAKQQKQEFSEKEQACREAEAAVRAAEQEVEECLKNAVQAGTGMGLLAGLFNREAVRAKKELAARYRQQAEEKKRIVKGLHSVMEEYQQECEEAARLLEQTEEEQKEDDRVLKKLENMRRDAQTAAVSCEAKQKSCFSAIVEAQNAYKKKIEGVRTFSDTRAFTPLDGTFMDGLLSGKEKESTQAQVANLWFTSAYNREREKLFCDALRLNKEFVLSSSCCLKNFRNLGLLWQERLEDEEKKKVTFHPQDREACFGALLQSLFLLVPVISTTFASVASFLKDIRNPGVLGTLIVDEAGQAPPQMAVGALFRSRRAVIVGDPRQVEPVVTDDLALLRKAYKEPVYLPYKPKKLSVQQLADIINPYGTWLEGEGNEEEWVGCPLVVHRRCISPMYEISNLISYNNTMKQQTRPPKPSKAAGFCYAGSRWINVKGKERGQKNHYVEEQGRRVLEILKLAFSKSDAPSLFIITPFTTVKSGMTAQIERHFREEPVSVLAQKKELVREWMYSCIGTVHTFQGMEADEVIFLLGCDAGKEAEGAVRWVNSNLVNVAVTRAKYRLYVVGDEAAWMENEYVRQAKRLLDTYALRELGDAVYNAQESEEKRKEKARQYASQLPAAEAFSLELAENGEAGTDIFFRTDIYLDELSEAGLLLKEVTDEQLAGYGFTREAFNALDGQVKRNVEWGIRLYSLLKSLKNQFGIREMDASCCGILFCKAVELQVKECFYEGLKKQVPDEKVKGRIVLSEAKKEKLALGTFAQIFGRQENRKKLAACMKALGRAEYDIAWWGKYAARLLECTQLRNQCCHSEPFSWKDMDHLLKNLFLKDKPPQKPILDGTLRESAVGKYLEKAPAE